MSAVEDSRPPRKYSSVCDDEEPPDVWHVHLIRAGLRRPNGTSDEVVYSTLRDLEQDPDFDRIVTLCVTGAHDSDWSDLLSAKKRFFPTRMPSGLQTLDVRWLPIRSLPTMPASLHTLVVRHTRLVAIDPGTFAACASLTSVDLTDNSIVELVGDVFPRSVRYLMTSGNPLRSRTGDFPRLHVPTEERAVGNVGPVRAVYDGAHNVHTSSIQDSVGRSVRLLMGRLRKDTSDGRSVDGLIDEMLAASDVDAPVRDIVTNLSYGGRYAGIYHSVLGATVKEILAAVWNVARDSPSRADIVPVLNAEILEGAKWCSTGMFSRIVNSLVGFVEGVDITINEAERLNGMVAFLWREVDGLDDRDLDDRLCGLIQAWLEIQKEQKSTSSAERERELVQSRPTADQLGAVGSVKAVQSRPTADQLGAVGSVKAVQSRPTADQLGAVGSVKAVQSRPTANQLGASGSVKAVQSRPTANQLGASGSVKAFVTAEASKAATAANTFPKQIELLRRLDACMDDCDVDEPDARFKHRRAFLEAMWETCVAKYTVETVDRFYVSAFVPPDRREWKE